LFEGYSTVAASGTTIVLTASSAQNYQITGSGGQVIRLPNATTLPNGALFTFNNNQSSGAITVQNNSSTTIATINSGGYVTVVLLDNTLAAGSWDRHDQTPSNVSWSTNTLDYPGSITSATWNGSTIAINRGGTNGTATPTAGAVAYGTGTAYGFTAAGSSGQVLQSNGSSAPTWATPSASITVTDDTSTITARYLLFTSATTGTISTEYVSSTKLQYVPSTGVLSATGFSGAGAFTTLSASSTVSGSGFTSYFASPPAIGGTTAAAGTFTTLTATADSAFTSTGALQLPSGTTAQQPTGVAGKIRYNTTTSSFEGYSGGAWASIGGGSTISDDTTTNSTRYPLFAAATSGTASTIYTSSTELKYNPSTGVLTSVGMVASSGLHENSATIAANYTIGTGNNAMSAGPITINASVSVTVPTGSVWVVL
jgi:hypothetical protein